MHHSRLALLVFFVSAATVALFSLTRSSARADEPAPVEAVPCAGTDQATVTAALATDRTMSQLRNWDLQSVEILSCDGPNIPLRLTWWSPASASRNLGLRFALVLELEYDVAGGKVVAPEPGLDLQRQAADEVVRTTDKHPVLAELKAAAEAAGGVLRAEVDGAGEARVFAEVLDAKRALATVRKDQLVGLALPFALEVPSSLQATAFKAVAGGIEHEGEVCPAPSAYEATRGDDGSWTFAFEHPKGTCKGKWQLVMAKDSSVSWERL